MAKTGRRSRLRRRGRGHVRRQLRVERGQPAESSSDSSGPNSNRQKSGKNRIRVERDEPNEPDSDGQESGRCPPGGSGQHHAGAGPTAEHDSEKAEIADVINPYSSGKKVFQKNYLILKLNAHMGKRKL